MRSSFRNRKPPQQGFIVLVFGFLIVALSILMSVHFATEEYLTSRAELQGALEEFLYSAAPEASLKGSTPNVSAALNSLLQEAVKRGAFSFHSRFELNSATATQGTDRTFHAQLEGRYHFVWEELLFHLRIVDKQVFTPLRVRAEMRPAPINLVVAMDLGKDSVPSQQLLNTHGGEIPGWTIPKFFSDRQYKKYALPYSPEVNSQSPARLTYSCFNPVINAIKKTGILLWQKLSEDALNATSVLFFPGQERYYATEGETRTFLGCGVQRFSSPQLLGKTLESEASYKEDVVQPLGLLSPSNVLGNASFPCVESSLGSSAWCTEIAEEADRWESFTPQYQHYHRPFEVYPKTQSVLSSTKSTYNQEAITTLSVPQALWTRGAYDTPGEVAFDLLLTTLENHLYVSEEEAKVREGLEGGTEHILMVLTPRTLPTSSDAEKQFRESLHSLLSRIKEDNALFQLYWIIIAPNFFLDSSANAHSISEASRIQQFLNNAVHEVGAEELVQSGQIKLKALPVTDITNTPSQVLTLLQANSRRMVARKR